MNVYSEVNIIQTFPLPLGLGLNMASCFGGRSFPCGSPVYACSLCHRLGPGWQGVGQHMGCCGNRGLWFLARVLQFLLSATQFFQRNQWVLLPVWTFWSFLYQFILFTEWLPLNIKLLNRTIHGPVYKWSRRGVCCWLGACSWCRGIFNHHIYGVTLS